MPQLLQKGGIDQCTSRASFVHGISCFLPSGPEDWVQCILLVLQSPPLNLKSGQTQTP